ncbi:hypothetical protein F5X96DRAFT_650990 [Biscogniauxia mediterranea]|nr:hypothetical protein F5X96DRAFT_650990 [Biscogniauxia mediterranea]
MGWDVVYLPALRAAIFSPKFFSYLVLLVVMSTLSINHGTRRVRTHKRGRQGGMMSAGEGGSSFVVHLRRRNWETRRYI